ncbi:hypothetical protein Ddye_031441 [Dipteronia dyeriana]|uniref:Uncharacterized protein n=1 Tax=Dipteronia dyeriana TaxID=168575 RepID=A0AAD9TJ97_9ROSI|nr:hypothetical protein Ddye_031441 [Dipteronia dyeriana]
MGFSAHHVHICSPLTPYKKQPRREPLRFFSSAVDVAAATLAHCKYIFADRVSYMEKPSSASDSGGAAQYNTVFVNTSLDTHLALIVSCSDTVADVKNKILQEHLLCFPNFGEINIQALKVKRRGNFYRLPDSMFVKSAFDGICKGWFLSVDASRLQKLVENQDSREPKSRDIVACFGITDNFGLLSDGPTRRLSDDGDSTLPQVQRDWHAKEKLSDDTNCDNNYYMSLDTNNRSDPELREKHELLDSNKCKDPIMRTGCDEDNFRNVISDDQFSVSLDGDGTSSAAGKRKRKPKAKKERGTESLEHALKENDAPDKDISQQDIVVPDNSLVSEDGVLIHDKVMGSKTIANKPCHISSDTSKSPGGEVHMTNVLSNGTAVPRNIVECEKENSVNAVLIVQCLVSMEEASPGPAKKKQKTLNSKNSSEVKLPAPVREVRENEIAPHSLDVDMSATYAGNDESINDPPEAAAASAVKGMRISDDRHTTEAEGNPPDAVQEGNDLKVSGVTVEPGKSSKKRKKSKKTQDPDYPVTVTQVTSGTEVPPVAMQEGNDLSKVIGIKHGSVMVNDSQKFGSDQMGRVEEERVTTDAGNDESTNDPPEAAVASAVKGTRISDDCHTTEAEGNPPVAVQEGNDLKVSGVTVEPGKSSKKIKKSKKTQDPVTQVTSGTEVPPVAVQEGNDLSKDIGIEHGSVMVNDSQKFGSDQTVRVEEERVLSQHNDSKTISSTMCTPFSRDEIDMNSKVVVTPGLLDADDNVEQGKSSKKRKKSAKGSPFSGEEIDMNSITEVTSYLLETNDIAKPGKSSKKKKKSKRTLDPLTSSTEHMTCSVIGISSTKQHETVRNDHLSDKSEKEEGILFPSEENEESQAKTVNAPILATDGETDNVIRNVLESLQDQDLSKTAENKVEKSGKKTKRKRSSGAKSIPELQTEDENVSCKNVNLAIDGTREFEVDTSSILTKKNLAKTSTEHQLNGSNYKPGKIAGVETDPLHSQLNVKSSQVLSYKPDDNNGESPLHGKNSKLSEVSGTGTKAPPPSNKSDKFNSKTKEATGPNTVNASRMIPNSNKKKETISASNSSLESFKSTIPQSERVNKHQSQVAVRKKISNNDNGEVLNSSKRQKSLLATSGTIFKFDSDRSSDDEDGVDNSDTSTRTPSENSLSSDYSDGDSSAPGNGSHSAKRNEQRGRNISNSQYSLNLDTILRSSKRYKAAKLTASQSQPLGFESQPDEFVPDSQPKL